MPKMLDPSLDTAANLRDLKWIDRLYIEKKNSAHVFYPLIRTPKTNI